MAFQAAGVSSGTGHSVAVDQSAGLDFQVVKLVGGVEGDFTGIGTGGSLPVSVVGGSLVAQMSGVAFDVTHFSTAVTVPLVAVQMYASNLTAGPNLTPVFHQSNALLVAVQTSKITPFYLESTGPLVTTADAGAAATGVIVRMAGSVTAAVTGNVGVSGAVSISAMPVVSMTGALISVVSTVLGTLPITGSVNVLSTVVVSGMGTIIAPASTTGSTGVSGVIVWLGSNQLTQTITGVSIGVTGPISISAMPVVSMTGALVSIVSTLLGTVNVNQIGLSNYVTNPASAASGIGVYLVGLSTTALSGVTGPVVWLGASQTVIVGNINTLSTVLTLLGTVNVALQTASWTAASPTAVSTGLIVWDLPAYSTTATPGAAQTGAVVWVANPGAAVATTIITVTIIAPASTTGASGVSGVVVWLGDAQTLATVNSILTVAVVQNVTAVGTVLAVTRISTVLSVINVTNVSSVVTLLGTINVTQIGLSNYVTNPASAASGIGVYIVGLSTTALSGVTGPQVWLGASQTVLATINQGLGGQIVITVTNTSVIATSTTQFVLMSVLFDAYTTTQLVSGYTVRTPFIITGLTMFWTANSVTASSVALQIYVTTSGVSITSAGAMLLYSTVFATLTGVGSSTTLNFPGTGLVLPGGGVLGLAVFRTTSLTTTITIAFSIVGQYLPR